MRVKNFGVCILGQMRDEKSRSVGELKVLECGFRKSEIRKVDTLGGKMEVLECVSRECVKKFILLAFRQGVVDRIIPRSINILLLFLLGLSRCFHSHRTFSVFLDSNASRFCSGSAFFPTPDCVDK